MWTGDASMGAEAAREERELHALVDRLTFGAAPGAVPAQSGVPRHVVVGIGADASTVWATEWARALAPLFAPRTTLVHVETGMPVVYAPFGAPDLAVPLAPRDREERASSRLLDETARRLREDGMEVDSRDARGHPVRELTRLAREVEADLLVVGSPSRGPLDRFLLGSTADGVKNHADTDVLLAKAPPLPGDVLCPVDGSAMSHRAAALAWRFARGWGAKLRVLHVVPPPANVPFLDKATSMRRLERRLDLPWSQLPGVDFALDLGDPGEAVARAAEADGTTLLVMGNRGLGGLRSLVTGSVTNYVVHHVVQSVLLVKGGRGESSLWAPAPF